MRTFFLFYLLSWLFRNPLIALAVVAAIFYLGEARYRGRWFDPTTALRHRQAVRDLRRTLELNEHNVGAHNDLGRLLVQERKYEEAAAHMEKAVARMEESPEANYYHGLCLLNAGRDDEGERFVRRALEINPRFLYGEPQLTLARHALTRNEPPTAANAARAAVKLNTSSVEGWTLLGRAEEELGRPEAAAAAYDSAKDAFRHLPAYLHLPNRKWLAEAKRGMRRVRS